jgi:hypothetical protein
MTEAHSLPVAPRRAGTRAVVVLGMALAALLIGASIITARVGDESSATVAPALPIWQRVLTGADLEGFVAQTEPPRILKVDAFVDAASTAFVRVTPASARRDLPELGFERALIATLSDGGPEVIASTVIEARSPEHAQRILVWGAQDSRAPCPGFCNVVIEPFRVSGLPEAHAVRRTRTAAAAKSGGGEPFDIVDVLFADGRFVYDVYAWAPKLGLLDPEELASAARALQARVAGSPDAVDRP